MVCGASIGGRVSAWLLGFLLFAQMASAMVAVQSVRFSRDEAPGVTGPWYEAAIELRAGAFTANNRFAGPIEVRLNLATRVGIESEARFEFYRSRVTLVGLEANQRAMVYFYLPPEIVRRDRIDRSEPFAWQVELVIDGQALPNLPASFSRSLADPPAAQSFVSRLGSEAARNDGLLQPIYETPFFVREAGKFRDLPTFVRRTESSSGGSSR